MERKLRTMVIEWKKTEDKNKVVKEMAALLYGGPRSVLTSYAALQRHRLPSALQRYGSAVTGAAAVDVLVPVQTQRRDAGSRP